METYAMRSPVKYEVRLLGMCVSAEGVLGIVASLAVFFGAIAFILFR
jgi:hypothetical protein